MSHFSTCGACSPHIHELEPALGELRPLIESAVGSVIAAIRLAELRAIAEANPAIANSFLAEELRRWCTCKAAASLSRRR